MSPSCPHLGPFDEGRMPCIRTTVHDAEASTGHQYETSTGIHGRPVRDEE